MMSALLGTAMVHVAYVSKVTDASLRRAQARSDMLSLTNLALQWLKKEAIKPNGIKSDGNLTNNEVLCIFSIEYPLRGSVTVFDLGYDPKRWTESGIDLLFFPPYYPGAYLVRAVVKKQGLASIMGESVYVLASYDVPGKGVVLVLDEKPLFSREIFR
jgi:hypothetical protein